MATVNLLPWRERRRYLRQRRFIRSLALLVMVSLIGVWFCNQHLGHQLQRQQLRNAFLQQHLAELEQRAQQQQELLQRRSLLLQQQQQLAAIQANPAGLVQLLETLAQAVPDSVYLTSLTQSAELIEMAGRVDQAANLTPLLRNLNASQLLSDATLVTLTTDPDQNSKLNSQFRLEVRRTDGVQESGG